MLALRKNQSTGIYLGKTSRHKVLAEVAAIILPFGRYGRKSLPQPGMNLESRQKIKPTDGEAIPRIKAPN
jgi:hypothetical protein